MSMTSYLSTKPAWLQLLIFGALTVGIMLAVYLVGAVAVAYFNHLSVKDLMTLTPDDYAKPAFAGITKGMLIVQFFGLFLLPSLLFAYLASPTPIAFAGLKKPDRFRFIFLGILIILCSYLMIEWLGIINQKMVQGLLGKAAQKWIEKSESDIDGTIQNILSMKTTSDLFEAVFLVGVLAAIGEELFFRGILQRILIQAFRKPWLGILITAAIFSAVHGQFLGFIPRLILGIILGALYWYSGSLWPAIAGHFVFNSLQVVLIYYKVLDINQSTSVGDRFVTFIGIGAMLVVIALLYIVRKQSTTTYEKVYKTPVTWL